jgi:succinate-semialdehyde dehydrogenase/glutarate-semialdehyde dehydrogenase
MKRYDLYLNGRWVNTQSSLKVINPATTEAFAEVPIIGRSETRQALEDAQNAWIPWRRLPGKTRGAYLAKTADALEQRREEIARLITLENGKPLAQSRGEVAMAVDHLRWFGEEAKRAYGRVVPNQVEGKRHLVIKAPLGVVAAIAPWNFPLVLSVRKVAPALAAGCPVILRPASATPLCAVALAECFDAADIPEGVFQLVAGPAKEIAGEFLSNPICRKITFTGSTEVGKQLIAGSANSVKRLSLELGGHAPVLIFEDADLKQAVEGALITKFRNTGQSCIAANRIYVQRPVYMQFLEMYVARVKSLKVGDGLQEGIDIGPMINPEGLAIALRHIEDAVSKGAKVITGGKRWGESKGYFLEPTVLAEVPESALCMKEETFAPVAPLAVFDEEEEAIRRANDSVYGLAAYVFTNNLQRAFRLMEEIEAGTIGLNDAVPSTSQCPFGGFKQSGLGRELGMEGLEAFLETKHVSIGNLQ